MACYTHTGAGRSGLRGPAETQRDGYGQPGTLWWQYMSCCMKIASPQVCVVYQPSVMRPNYAQWPTTMQPVLQGVPTAECWLQLMAETDSVKFNLKAGKRSTSALLEYWKWRSREQTIWQCRVFGLWTHYWLHLCRYFLWVLVHCKPFPWY